MTNLRLQVSHHQVFFMCLYRIAVLRLPVISHSSTTVALAIVSLLATGELILLGKKLVISLQRRLLHLLFEGSRAWSHKDHTFIRVFLLFLLTKRRYSVERTFGLILVVSLPHLKLNVGGCWAFRAFTLNLSERGCRVLDHHRLCSILEPWRWQPFGREDSRRIIGLRLFLFLAFCQCLLSFSVHFFS